MTESEERATGGKAPKARIDATPAPDAPSPGDDSPKARPDADDLADAAATGPAGAASAVRGLRSWLDETFPGHVNAVVFAFLGFLVALLLFAIGLWRTLVLVLLVTAGVAFGQYLDGDPKVIRFLSTLFSNGGRR